MALHDSHKQLTTIADSLLDVSKRLARLGKAEAEEIARLSRALQVEITFLVPTEPVSPHDAIMQRWFAECCTPSGHYSTSDMDAQDALQLWLQENHLDLPSVKEPSELVRGTREWEDWVNINYGMGAWICANYPPTSTGDVDIFPFTLNPEVKQHLTEHRASINAEHQRRQKMFDDRGAINIKVLTPWFLKYKETLPDRIAVKEVNANAKKALKGKAFDQHVVIGLMRDAGYRYGNAGHKFGTQYTSFWERKR